MEWRERGGGGERRTERPSHRAGRVRRNTLPQRGLVFLVSSCPLPARRPGLCCSVQPCSRSSTPCSLLLILRLPLSSQADRGAPILSPASYHTKHPSVTEGMTSLLYNVGSVPYLLSASWIRARAGHWSRRHSGPTEPPAVAAASAACLVPVSHRNRTPSPSPSPPARICALPRLTSVSMLRRSNGRGRPLNSGVSSWAGTVLTRPARQVAVCNLVERQDRPGQSVVADLASAGGVCGAADLTPTQSRITCPHSSGFRQ